MAQAESIPAEHGKFPTVDIKITTPKGVVIFMEGTVKSDISLKITKLSLGRFSLQKGQHGGVL